MEPLSSLQFNEESWKSTRVQRSLFASGCTTVLISLAKFVLIFLRGSDTNRLSTIFAAVVGYVLADLVTGIVHWVIDNYGNPKHPIFGPQIEGILRHHQHPWILANRHVATNIYIQGAAVTIVFMPMNIFYDRDLNLFAFVTVFACCVLFSQQFHAWAHTSKGKLPPLVAVLQDAGIILRRSHHAGHHLPPFNKKYCIVNGVCDWFLDKFKFFVGIEVLLYHMFGVKPVSWE